MAINKVIFGNKVVVDLSQDSATVDDVLKGKSFHLNSGVGEIGNLKEISNIDFYKIQDLNRIMTEGGELATDEEYAAAEIRLQEIYNRVMRDEEENV